MIESLLDPRSYIKLERELQEFTDSEHIAPLVIFAQLKLILAAHGFQLEDQDLMTDFSDVDSDYYFELYFPKELSDGKLFLTVSFEVTERKTYLVDVNILTEEELQEYIGEDEVEEI